MFNRIKTTNLDDYFTQLDRRKEKGVYFYRINGYNQETAEFLQKYYEESRLNGVIVEGGIPNPDGKSSGILRRGNGNGLCNEQGVHYAELTEVASQNEYVSKRECQHSDIRCT